MAAYPNIHDIGAKNGKRTVYIKVNFLKISEVNTKREEFTADVHVQIRWREPLLDKAPDSLEVDPTNYWSPNIIVYNVVPDHEVQKSLSVVKGNNGQAFVVERRRIKGAFVESLELEEFPFDVQDLSVIVSSVHSTEEIEIIEDENELSAVNVDCFVNETEWNVMNLVYTEQAKAKLYSSEHFSHYRQENPTLSVKCVVKRRPAYFMYNTILIMTMITGLSFTTFAVSRLDTASRLTRSFIILLTGVTFKTIVNDSLPKIPYLTQLNIYVVGSMVLNWMVCVWHAIISRWKDDQDLQETMDLWAFIVLGCLIFLFNLIFFLIVIIRRLRRSSQVDKRRKTYEEKAKRLNCGPTCDPRRRQNGWGRRSNSRVDAY